MGKSVINWGGVVEPTLAENSMYPLQTGIATKEFAKLQEMDKTIQNMKATLDSYGMTKLSTASDVTDANAYALSAVEKNRSISGTLGNDIKILGDRLGGIKYVTSLKMLGYSVGETFSIKLEAGGYFVIAAQGLGWGSVYLFAFMIVTEHTPFIDIIKAGSNAPTCTIDTTGTFSATSNVEPGYNILFYRWQ